MSDTKPNQKPELQLQPVQSAQSSITMDDVINKLIPALAANLKSGQPVAPGVPAPRMAPKMCTECKQQLSACSGKHTQMVVYPVKYPQHADYFPGARINGVTYLSNDPNHKVTVPEIAEATILGIVAGFEENEQAMAVGRKAERHSGTVSPNGARVIPANAAWR